MKITKFDCVEIECCAKCPYYYEEPDMGATLSGCKIRDKKMGCSYDSLLEDINWHNANKKISKDCPYTREYDKEVWHEIIGVLING